MPVTDSILTGVTIEFNTHDDNKNSDTTLNIHIVNRLSATQSQDISVATDVDHGQEFPRLRRHLQAHRSAPCVECDLFQGHGPADRLHQHRRGQDQWIFDYRVTFFFGQDQPYSWTASGVVLNQDQHKHMGVYNGRSFPTLHYPHGAADRHTRSRATRRSRSTSSGRSFRNCSTAGKVGSPDPLIKLRLDSSENFGDQMPLSYMDTGFIANDPPPPDGQPLDPGFQMGVTWPHSISELGQFTTWFGLGVYLVDINSQALTLAVNSGDNQTPLTMTLQFETGGPTEIHGSISIDIVKFEVT